MAHWQNIEEAYPNLFEGEATTSANVPTYPTPLGPILRPPLVRREDEIPEEYRKFLGLDELQPKK
jgi:hypothetical protein